MQKQIQYLLLGAISFSLACKTAKHTTNKGTASTNDVRVITTNAREDVDMSQSNPTGKHPLDGNWVFVTMPGKMANFGEMYADGLPMIDIATASSKANGFGGCNKFTATVSVKGQTLKIEKLVFLTKAACPSMGDQAFANALENATSYAVKGNELTLLNGKTEMMKLRKTN